MKVNKLIKVVNHLALNTRSKDWQDIQQHGLMLVYEHLESTGKSLDELTTNDVIALVKAPMWQYKHHKMPQVETPTISRNKSEVKAFTRQSLEGAIFSGVVTAEELKEVLEVPDCSQEFEDREFGEFVMNTMNDLLTPNERRVITLIYFEGLNTKEAAEDMKTSQSSVVRLHKSAMDLLKEKVK